jgi:hypothetical protein
MSDPNIYEQLNTFTLSNVSAEDITNITEKTHLQFQNEFDLERYNLINRATFRDGNPIPKTCVVTQTASTESGVKYTVKLPNKGEVWMILNAHVLVVSPSGNIQHELYWLDNNNSRSMLWFFHSSSSSNLTLQQDTDWTPPFLFDSNLTLQYEGTGTFTSSTISIMMLRVR